MPGTTISIKGVLTDFLTPILTNIGRDPTKESLIDLCQFISGNAAYVELKLRGGWNIQLALTIKAKEYMEQMCYVFIPPHKPGNYPPMMVTAQEQVLVTEGF